MVSTRGQAVPSPFVPDILIAFDNVDVDPKPSKWHMHRLLLGSSILALIGVVQSSGMLRHLHHGLQLSPDAIQTTMFLQLVVAGHLLLFSTRSRRWFFQPPLPEWKFFTAIMGTQLLAALMAVNGWLVSPITWRVVGLVWVYNLCWLVVIDFVKRVFARMAEDQDDGRAPWQRRLHQPLDSFHGLQSR